MTLLLAACELRFGATATPQPTATEPPAPVLTVVWAAGGDLFAWREGVNTNSADTIAAGAVIQPFLAPDGGHVAFTRGAQGDAIALWAVGSDGTGERELVAPDVIPSIRDGHPQIGRVAWLDDHTIYFDTYQQHESGISRDDNLYRVELDGAPQLILPPGSGGEFAFSPDGQHIAVVRAGIYDMQKGSIAVLDPHGIEIDEKLTFTAVSAPSEAPFYPPLSWSADSTFVRVPIPARDTDRVALWRVPVEGEAQIFGYITAARDGLPVWGGASERMIYWRYGQSGTPELLIADANGENAEVYDSGDLSNLRWLDDGVTFAFDKGNATGLGQRGASPGLMDFPRLRFLAHGIYIFVLNDTLSYSNMSGNEPITGIYPPLPEGALFDAVVAPAQDFAP